MKLTKTERAELKQKFGGHCAYCGIELNSKFQADHVIAVHRDMATGLMSRPGHDVFENLYPACMPCNNKKRGGDLEDFRRDLSTMLERMNTQDKFAFYRHAKRFGLVQEVQHPVVFYFERLAQGEQHGASVQFPREDQSGTCPGSNGMGNQGEKTNA